MEKGIEEATQNEGLLVGNLLKACAGLRHLSRTEGFEPTFHWQQLGDLRYSFANWIHDPQPRGPLGYGPTQLHAPHHYPERSSDRFPNLVPLWMERSLMSLR